MIDYLADIKPLQDQGLSPSDIVSHLNCKTQTAMNPEECRYIFQDSGAVLTDPVNPTQRTGSLISYYQGLSDGDVKKLIAFFVSRVYNGEQVATNQWPRSVQFFNVENSLPEELQNVCAELVRSAGGRIAQPVTEADLTAAQQAWEEEEASRQQIQEREYKYTTLYNQNIVPLIDSINADDAAWQAALNNMATEWGN